MNGLVPKVKVQFRKEEAETEGSRRQNGRFVVTMRLRMPMSSYISQLIAVTWQFLIFMAWSLAVVISWTAGIKDYSLEF